MIRYYIAGGLALAFAAANPGDAFAQAEDSAGQDTLSTASYRLDAITVVAYGRSTVLRESAVATTVLTRKSIGQLPARTLSDVLAYVPGLIFLERDGSGQLPMAVARGFFGGGETAYVRLIIDGVPVNDMRTGAVEWPQIPLSAVEHIEVVRGGASTMYGDAAMGAVVSVITQPSTVAPYIRGTTGLGAWGERLGQVTGSWPLGAGAIDANGSWSQLDGFRDHSDSEDVSFAGSYRSSKTAPYQFTGRVFGRRLIRDEPGPLTIDEASLNPRQSRSLFAADHRNLGMLDLATGIAHEISESRAWKWDAALRIVDDDEKQSLQLTSDFADTQVRDERNWNLSSRFQYEASFDQITVTVGTEVEYGAFSTEYRAPDDSAALLTSSTGNRLKLGAYAESRHRVAERLNLYAGIRLDVLDVSRDDTDDSGASYAEISPRVGINFAISRNRISPGHVYASVARSFKAPTLDQLYDVREFPAGQGAVSISNPDLQPQTADAIEVGVLQRFPLWSDAFAELDLALYRISVDDEIDFDLSTFRFGNIQESRHDGLELSFTARLLRWISVRHSSTFMRVVFRSGELAGNRLKNIPRNSLATAVFLSPFPTVQFSLTHRHTGSLALDDGNSHEISAYDRFGARADWSRGRLAIYLSANNLFDRQASSLGFLSFNPATGQQVPFVYPIGGRAVRLGVSVSGS